MNLVLKNYLSQIASDSSLESCAFGTVVRIHCMLNRGESRVSSFTAKNKSLCLDENSRYLKAFNLYSQISEWLKSEELVIGLGSERYGLLVTKAIHRAWMIQSPGYLSSDPALAHAKEVTLQWDVARRRGDRLGVVIVY